MEMKRLAGLTALLVVTASLAGCQNAKQSQIVNITGPTSVTGGDNGGGGNPPPTPNPAPNPTPNPFGSAPGSFTLSLVSCTPAGPGQNEARISFSPASGAVNYRVERRIGSLGPWISQGVHSGPMFAQIVGNGSKVWYSVIALNAHGETRSSPIDLFVCDEVRDDGNGGGGNPPPTNNPNPNPPPTDPTPTPAQKPTVSISANPPTTDRGNPLFLNWSSQHAKSCVASEGWTGIKSTAGVQSVSPLETTSFCMICSGDGGFSERACVNVTVRQPPPPSSRTITLSPVGGSGKAGTTLQTVAVCRDNGQIVSCSPYWFSSRVGTPSTQDASRVSVGPNSGLITFISQGSADICVQWSRTEVTPRACGTFTTVP